MAIFPFSVTTTGANGSATGSTTIPLTSGFIHYVLVDYHASAPNTTVVKITETNTPQREVVSVPAGNTDKVLYPVVQSTTTAGVAVTGIYQKQYITSTTLTVTVTLSNALTGAVTGFVQIEPYP